MSTKETLEERLLFAINQDDLILVKELIDSGADVNALQWPNIDIVNINEASPLMLAATFGYTDCMALLIEHGANVNVRSTDFHIATPLIAATITNNLCGVELLLRRGAVIDETDGNGNTAFLVGCDDADEDSVPVLRCLIEHGANPHRVNHQGHSALMESLSDGDDSLPVMEFLIASGVDIDHRNKAGETVIEMADRLGYRMASCFLKDYLNSRKSQSVLDKLIRAEKIKKEFDEIAF